MTQVGGRTGRVKQKTHEGFLRHRGFFYAQVATALCVAAVGAYWWLDTQSRLRGGEPMSGGTWLGYILGTVSAGLIVWLSCLGIRKRVITDGPYSLKAWTSAHVYLGLSLTILATLHTGFQFGWNVHTLAYVLMMLVIASGAVGVWAYATLPTALSKNRGEQTRKTMIRDIGELDAQLKSEAQPLDSAGAGIVRTSLEGTRLEGGFFRRAFNRYGDCGNARAVSRMRGYAPSDPVQKAAAETCARIMEQKASVLKTARRQMQITAILEGWLFVHIPATIALLAALTAHIVSVFMYW